MTELHLAIQLGRYSAEPIEFLQEWCPMTARPGRPLPTVRNREYIEMDIACVPAYKLIPHAASQPHNLPAQNGVEILSQLFSGAKPENFTSF